MKKIILLLTLVLVLALSFGCAKKQAEPEFEINEWVDVSSAEMLMEQTTQQITDGVIYFDYNKYDVKQEYRPILQQTADIMRQYPSIRIRIEGNCDARGTQEYNLALGERRARSAYEYLILLGVNPNQIELISYGKERPAVLGDTAEAYAANRRDNFRVISY